MNSECELIRRARDGDQDAFARAVEHQCALVLDGALSYYRHSSPGGVGRLSQPALIVGGTSDILPTEMFTHTPELFDSRCEVLIAQRAGHWPHREAAEEFLRGLTAFLQSSDL